MLDQAFFLTVDWCSRGHRGLFCDAGGNCFRKASPHTEAEMDEILGPFSLVLSPRSLPYVEADFVGTSRWVPLEEYSGKYGVAFLPGRQPK